MRKEENSFSTLKWEGSLGPQIGDRTETLKYELTTTRSSLTIGIFGPGLYTHLYAYSLPHLLNFYRDLSEALNEMQPGLIFPLPDGDPHEVDAMKVVFEADRLRKGDK